MVVLGYYKNSILEWTIDPVPKGPLQDLTKGAIEMLFIEYPKCSTCQKAKKWLDESGINEKQYYYWQRRIRNLVAGTTSKSLPATRSNGEVKASVVPSAEQGLLKDVTQRGSAKHGLAL